MQKEITLNNGVLMPNVGIGTYLLEPQDAENSVREALQMGYRLIPIELGDSWFSSK